MTLSLILCSRNDEYMGNSRWRLETTLNYVAERVQELGPRARDGAVEVLVADWGSEIPLRDVLRLTPAAARIVSFVTVPPALARERQQDSPFPEVLALNAAARRARGAYIGRIDQDTLVGAGFLRTFFGVVEGTRRLGVPGVTPETALLFSNRRSIPYRFTARSPDLGQVTRFVRIFGRRLTVWQRNAATDDVFWTSYVGIWLAHRDLWQASGGYDERLIYYNWMETDMICRLRQTRAVVDLGELTGHDFYHLEHNDPRIVAAVGRPHGKNNPRVHLAAPPPVLHPNGADWGLNDVSLPRESVAPAVDGTRRSGSAAFARLMLGVAAETAADRVSIFWKARGPSSGQRIHPRRVLAAALRRVGWLVAARRVRLRARILADRELRHRNREDRERFSRFSRESGRAIGHKVGLLAGASGTALVVSSRCPTIEGELCTIKALQRAGWRPVVLLEDERRALRPFYKLAGVDEVRFWSEFLTPRDYSSEAAAAMTRCGSVDDLMTLTREGVRVGMITACTALRRMRVGALDWYGDGVRERLTLGLAASLSAIAEVRGVLRAVRPQLVLTDTEYTPKGELFETCLAHGLDVIAHDSAHRGDALMFKRYGAHNRNQHWTTLSAAAWALVRDLEWTQARQGRLARELETSYQAGDWYGTPWTRPESSMGPADVREALGLDPGRKTAVICPHILWDAPVMWGKPLFPTYQDWFVETVQAACRNTGVNWVIKIHPAHVRKQADERYRGEPAELRVLREHFGTLPPHVTVLPPDTSLNTLSLLPAMDYCLTVRGTVGVEAARLGIPVLTAGPARYAELGFTVDSASREEYLARVASIEAIPPLSDVERELAGRYAYGLFLMRPWRFESVMWEPPESGGSREMIHRRARLTVTTEEDWRQATDVGALAQWFASRDEDFLNSGA